MRRHLQRYHELVVATAAAHRRARRAPAPDRDSRELSAALERGLAEVLATETADALVDHGRHAEGRLRPRHRAAQRPRVLRRGARHAAAGRTQGGAQAQLRLRQRHLRAVQGARRLRRASRRSMPHDYPLSEAERLQGYTLLCAHSAASSEIVHRDAGGAADRGEIPEQEIARARARRHAARAGHAAAAPADAAHQPAALPRRPVRDAVRRRRRRRRAGRLPDRELPLRRPQPALPRRAATPATRSRSCCSTARSRPAMR